MTGLSACSVPWTAVHCSAAHLAADKTLHTQSITTIGRQKIVAEGWLFVFTGKVHGNATHTRTHAQSVAQQDVEYLKALSADVS